MTLEELKSDGTLGTTVVVPRPVAERTSANKSRQALAAAYWVGSRPQSKIGKVRCQGAPLMYMLSSVGQLVQ